MAIADFDSYRAKYARPVPSRVIDVSKNSQNLSVGRIHSAWTTAPFAGATPTTAAAPTSATAGALGQPNPTGDLRLIGGCVSMAVGGVVFLVDRLSHQGGLSGTVTTAQTTNLPTAALTRYTDGVGVMIGLEIYTQIGATGTTVTCSYTNQDGTNGRTSQATVLGGAGFREAQRVIELPLQEGDYGVRSVEDVTLAGTTGTAGNFGITLYKPLMMFPAYITGQTFEWDSLLNAGGCMPEILDDACLAWMVVGFTLTSGVTQSRLIFSED